MNHISVGVGGLTLAAPSQPIMSDGSGPPAREGGGLGWGKGVQWVTGKKNEQLRRGINDICITQTPSCLQFVNVSGPLMF